MSMLRYRASMSGVQNFTLVMSRFTERFTRRPPDACIPRQFWNESLTSR